MEEDWLCCVKRFTFARRRMVWHARQCEGARNEMGVKKAGQRIGGLGRLAWRKSDKEPFCSPKMDLPVAFKMRSELREDLFGGQECGYSQSEESLRRATCKS